MKTIGIIDDDIHISNMLEEALRKAGYGVLRAYSGTEALYLLDRHHPDLVLLDLMLPGLSGEEVLPHIKEGLAYRLEHETNTLLDIPSRDGAMRDLASCLNSQLILLREERWRFQQGDQALREAVTHISHDLRTPLTAIYGYLDLLETTDDLPEIRRYLWQIRGRAEAMTDLTEELFRYLILPSEHDLIFQDTDLGRVLEDTLLSFYGAFHQKNIQPEIHLPDSRVIRSLDSSCLNRILGNIVSNVLKYSDGDLIQEEDIAISTCFLLKATPYLTIVFIPFESISVSYLRS